MIRVFMFCEKTKVRQMRLQHDTADQRTFLEAAAVSADAVR